MLRQLLLEFRNGKVLQALWRKPYKEAIKDLLQLRYLTASSQPATWCFSLPIAHGF